MEKIKYNNILLDIIKRNGGSRRWPNLYLVEIDTYWDPFTDDIDDWIQVDYRYPIYLNSTKVYESRKRQYEEPSYFAFYMDSMEIEIDHDSDRSYLRRLKRYRPHVAFKGEQGVLKIQAMCCGEEFECYPFVISSKMMDRYEEELNGIIKKICLGSLSIHIEDNTEFEKQFCNLLDVIFGYTIIHSIGHDLGSYIYDLEYVGSVDEIIDIDNLVDGLHGSSFDEDTGDWQYFDYQHICLLYINSSLKI